MILCLIALGLCYIVWCLEGGHHALILARIEIGLITVASVLMLIGIVQILRQIIY